MKLIEIDIYAFGGLKNLKIHFKEEIYLLALLFESRMLITTIDKTSEIPPCIALNKMFTTAVANPYKIHSKTRYPKIIISSATIALIAMLIKRFENLLKPL